MIVENGTLSAEYECGLDVRSCASIDPNSILTCKYCGYHPKKPVEK